MFGIRDAKRKAEEARRDVSVVTVAHNKLHDTVKALQSRINDLKTCEECGLVFMLPERAASLCAPEIMTRQMLRAYGLTPGKRRDICPHCRPAHDRAEKLAAFARENPEKVEPAYEAHLKEQQAAEEVDDE